MKKLYLPLFLCFLFSIAAEAQSERFRKKPKASPRPNTEVDSSSHKPAAAKSEPQSFMDRLVYGGGAGLSFGDNTNIFLAPQVGYQINDNWVAGVGYMYNYAKWNTILTSNGFQDVDFENQIHGPNVFANYNFFNSAFVGTQLEVLNHDVYTYNNARGAFDISNAWTPVLFIQGGIFQQLGNGGFMQLGIRLNVLHDESSPYAQSWAPIFQLFF